MSAQIKSTHKAIAAYYDALKTYAVFDAAHEGTTETAFSHLLATTANSHGWTLILAFTPKGLYSTAQGREALRAHPG